MLAANALRALLILETHRSRGASRIFLGEERASAWLADSNSASIQRAGPSGDLERIRDAFSSMSMGCRGASD